jgi:hypothetical protein
MRSLQLPTWRTAVSTGGGVRAPGDGAGVDLAAGTKVLRLLCLVTTVDPPSSRRRARWTGWLSVVRMRRS